MAFQIWLHLECETSSKPDGDGGLDVGSGTIWFDGSMVIGTMNLKLDIGNIGTGGSVRGNGCGWSM